LALFVPSAKITLAFNGARDSESELKYSDVNGNVFVPLAATFLKHTITRKEKEHLFTILL